MTLETRTVMFHRTFPNKRINATKLWRIYKQHRITRKNVRRQKVPPPNTLADWLLHVRTCRNQVLQAKADGLQIIYCDETVFTKQTLLSRDYGAKGEKIEVDEKDVYVPYASAIAAVSEERGLEFV